MDHSGRGLLVLYILQYVELNGFSLSILVLIYLNMRHRGGRYLTDQKLFLALSAVDGLLLVLDTAMWLMDGHPGEGLHTLYLFTSALYNILNPVICAIWYLYVNYYIFSSAARLRRALPFLFLPILLNALLSISSFFTGAYFIIDENNVYRRGPLIPFLLATCLFLLVFTVVFLIRNRDRLDRKEYYYLLFFVVPASVGGILQFLFYGLVILWACVTFSILVIFINFQNDQLRTDHLTGLYNRRYLDNYLQAKLQGKSGRLIGGIMIDLNGFKSINDTYGHAIGDHALKAAARLLRKTFSDRDFIARYGGDEFVILMDLKKPEELSAATHRLLEEADLFNSRVFTPYQVNLCLGYDTFTTSPDLTATAILSRIDHLMYQNKKAHG